MLSLANYLKTKNYWAKDLVFLFTSEGELGTEAWMDAYLGQQMPGIVASSLQGHSGSIQAVFNLELESPFFDYVEIIVGFKEMLRRVYFNITYLSANRHRIDAVTIRGVGNSQQGTKTQNMIRLGRDANPVPDYVEMFVLLLSIKESGGEALAALPSALSLPCTITQPSGLSSQCAHWFSQTSLLLLSPPMWALYFCALYTFSLSAPSADLRDVIVDSITMAMTGVASSYNAWHLLGCWLYWAMCLCVWPLWMMAWSLTCLQQVSSPKEEGCSPSKESLQAMGLGEGNQKGYSHSKDSQVFDGSPSPTSRSIVKDSSSHSID
eukprot:Em0018g332a